VPSQGTGLQQLGLGVYISPKFQDWYGQGNDIYDCAIFASDSTAWDQVQKAWVPKSYTDADGKCQELWYDDGSEYISMSLGACRVSC
jgi:hypothetical protein